MCSSSTDRPTYCESESQPEWIDDNYVIYTTGGYVASTVQTPSTARNDVFITSISIVKQDQFNSECVLIPAGCTSLVQPTDVSMNRLFNAKMKEQWVEWFRSNNDLTQRGNRKQPNASRCLHLGV